MADLSAIVLVYNEEKHVARLLANLSRLCKAVYVVDSFSTDATVEKAEAGGAIVLKNPFVNYAKQFEWAIDNAPVTTEWVMRIDADEVLTDELVTEIERTLPGLAADVHGVNLNRRHIFLGRWIRHGGRYPLTLLRIWRRGHARIEQRWMDEHMTLASGRAITLHHDFCDHNLNDLTFFTNKHNQYATREAIDQMGMRHGLFDVSGLDSAATSRQAAMKRRIKEKLYNRLPIWVGPACYFFFRYFVQLGFLDGREGLIYHVLQGFWYRFLVAAKVAEFERSLPRESDENRKIMTLSRLTGYSLEAFR
ncbi:MAG TPA: glycosyltransferase family 2 protein [Roseiarcus sp.]|jgi:glycosyltransferase involved in cell wall biosynthesis